MKTLQIVKAGRCMKVLAWHMKKKVCLGRLRKTFGESAVVASLNV